MRSAFLLVLLAFTAPTAAGQTHLRGEFFDRISDLDCLPLPDSVNNDEPIPIDLRSAVADSILGCIKWEGPILSEQLKAAGFQLKIVPSKQWATIRKLSQSKEWLELISLAVEVPLTELPSRLSDYGSAVGQINYKLRLVVSHPEPQPDFVPPAPGRGKATPHNLRVVNLGASGGCKPRGFEILSTALVPKEGVWSAPLEFSSCPRRISAFAMSGDTRDVDQLGMPDGASSAVAIAGALLERSANQEHMDAIEGLRSRAQLELLDEAAARQQAFELERKQRALIVSALDRMETELFANRRSYDRFLLAP